MNRERWGIYPHDKQPISWWGARAILKNRSIDILYDRQSYEGEKDDDFLSWINTVAIKQICEAVKTDQTKGGFDSVCGRYHCEFDDRMSFGYLYIGCWGGNDGEV